MNARSLSFGWLVALCLAVGCGGSSKPAETATKAESSSESAPKSAAPASDEEPAAAAPARASCDDGTCTTCGDAVCPSGWYCDESAPGGPACGWVPECVQKATCGCVKKAFAGCSCEDTLGAAHLSCR